MKIHELDFDSPVFTELKAMLSMNIIDTVKRMNNKNLAEGTVSAKIKIGMMQTVDENGEIHSTAIFEPKVTAKVGDSSEDKCGATGGRIVVNADGSVLIGSEQVTMDELIDDQRGA
ncbi:MAG: hypothetical protein K6F61_04960 [Clostridiales bacterium]|nr:hypothetical protein [Clostridiales bacterium]